MAGSISLRALVSLSTLFTGRGIVPDNALLRGSAQLAIRGEQEATQEAAFMRMSTDMSMSERLELLLPIAWLHIPRCGSSFINTLIHNPSICNKMPDDARVLVDERGFPLEPFFEKYPKNEFCRGGFTPKYIYSDPPGHLSVASVYDQIYGHGIVMLRQPEQRLISAFQNHAMGTHVDIWPITLKDYAKLQEGCMVKMFVRKNHKNDGSDEHSFGRQGPCLEVKEPSPPSAEETQLAIHRMKTGFPFVGITDQFDLSVCLFHVMFGGTCQDYMFHDIRPSNVTDLTGHKVNYDTSVLEGWRDRSDNALYEEAKNIFQASLDRFGVSKANCPRICNAEHKWRS